MGRTRIGTQNSRRSTPRLCFPLGFDRRHDDAVCPWKITTFRMTYTMLLTQIFICLEISISLLRFISMLAENKQFMIKAKSIQRSSGDFSWRANWFIHCSSLFKKPKQWSPISVILYVAQRHPPNWEIHRICPIKN